MLSWAGNLKIFVYTPAADMRNGFNGLSGIIRSELQSDPADGSLFLFINRRRDRMKLLHFDGGGYWLYGTAILLCPPGFSNYRLNFTWNRNFQNACGILPSAGSGHV